MNIKLLSILVFFGFICCTVYGAQNTPTIDTSAYEKRLETIQKDEKVPQNQRDLAGQIAMNLKEKDYQAALKSLERLVLIDRKSSAAFEAKVMVCELIVYTSGNVMTAQRQFRLMTGEQKKQALEVWPDRLNALKNEKNELVKQAFGLFLSEVGEWGQRADDPNAGKIQMLAASLLPKTDGTRAAAQVYDRVARSGQDVETREKALFDMAEANMESDRFSEALAALRRITSPDSIERRFDTVIQVCLKNPDSHAALGQLRQEQSICPPGLLRNRFDIAIAQIYLREELYDEAETHLLAADAQYSYQAIVNDLKKRYESENQANEQLRKRIAERIEDIVQGKKK